MAIKRKTARAGGLEAAELASLRGQLAALNKGFAAIECQPDGTLLTANENFLRLMGYELTELQGQRHELLSGSADSSLWEKLGRAEQEVGRFKRLAKGGREVWLQGSYSPVVNAAGAVSKVVFYALDVSEQAQIQAALEQQYEDQIRAGQEMAQAVVKTQEIIRAATEGDLSRRLDVSGQTGDLMKLGNAINTLLESVSDIVSSVKNAAAEVLRGAEEISQGNANLSQRTEEQSSSLEETASSMEEMTSTVKQNADNAGQANQLSSGSVDLGVLLVCVLGC